MRGEQTRDAALGGDHRHAGGKRNQVIEMDEIRVDAIEELAEDRVDAGIGKDLGE
jgi:hypothetical protein